MVINLPVVSSFMVKISSDNPNIEKRITQMCASLEKNGSYIDPDVEIHDVNGQTSVLSGAEGSSKYIFKSPHALLVPYDNFDFDIEGQDIVIAHDDRNTSKEHLEILDSMIALYNESGKFKDHIKEHPLLRFQETPELAHHLLGGREGKDIDIVHNISGDPDFFDELALLTFFKSRLLRCCLHKREAEPKTVLIPVVEFLNHHAAGAGFDNLYHEQGSYMATRGVMPVPESRECFTNYGRLDSLDTYLHYGFVDQGVKYVRSIPTEIDLGDIGSISIGAFNAVVPLNDVPEHLSDLAYYFPKMQIDHTDKKAELSHIFIPQENAPLSMRRILEYVIQLLEPKIDPQTCLKCIEDSENHILKYNIEYYNKLKLLAENKTDNSTTDRNAVLLSEVQKTRIIKYKEILNGL